MTHTTHSDKLKQTLGRKLGIKADNLKYYSLQGLVHKAALEGIK
jgi:hypothetical protein